MSIIDNTFSNPDIYQMQLWMDAAAAQAEIIFSGNEFRGPNCMFSVGGQDIPSEYFLEIAQPGTVCVDQATN